MKIIFFSQKKGFHVNLKIEVIKNKKKKKQYLNN